MPARCRARRRQAGRAASKVGATSRSPRPRQQPCPGQGDVAPDSEPPSKADASAGTSPSRRSRRPRPRRPPKRTGQIAAFVSRKDSKLYVRQNFAPLFDVPVEIAATDRPLGTHVFTARLDKDNPTAIALVGGVAARGGAPRRGPR